MHQSESKNYSPGKSARFEARLSDSQKVLLQHAADLLGRTLSDFVITVSQEAARRIIRENEIITLTQEQSVSFVNVLVEPSQPNSALKNALKHYQTFTKNDE